MHRMVATHRRSQKRHQCSALCATSPFYNVIFQNFCPMKPFFATIRVNNFHKYFNFFSGRTSRLKLMFSSLTNAKNEYGHTITSTNRFRHYFLTFSPFWIIELVVAHLIRYVYQPSDSSLLYFTRCIWIYRTIFDAIYSFYRLCFNLVGSSSTRINRYLTSADLVEGKKKVGHKGDFREITWGKKE